MLVEQISYPIKGRSPPTPIQIQTYYGTHYEHPEGYKPNRFLTPSFGLGVISGATCDTNGDCTALFTPNDNQYGEDTQNITFFADDQVTSQEIASDGYLPVANDLTNTQQTTLNFNVRSQPKFIFSADETGVNRKHVANCGERVNETGYEPSETAIFQFASNADAFIADAANEVSFKRQYGVDVLYSEINNVTLRIQPDSNGTFQYWDQDAGGWADFKPEGQVTFYTGSELDKLKDATDNSNSRVWEYGRCSFSNNDTCKVRFVPNLGFTGVVTKFMQIGVYDTQLRYPDDGSSGDYFWSNEETLQMRVRPAPKTQDIAVVADRKLVIQDEDITLTFDPALAFAPDYPNNKFQYRHSGLNFYGTNWFIGSIEAVISSVNGLNTGNFADGHTVTTTCPDPAASGSCTLTYTPKPGYNGTVNIDYRVLVDDRILGTAAEPFYLESNLSTIYFSVYPKPISHNRKIYLPVSKTTGTSQTVKQILVERETMLLN